MCGVPNMGSFTPVQLDRITRGSSVPQPAECFIASVRLRAGMMPERLGAGLILSPFNHSLSAFEPLASSRVAAL